MLTLNQTFFLQVFIFIFSIPSLSILYSIIIQKNIEIIFFVKGVIFISLYYFFWSIFLIVLTSMSCIIKNDYYGLYINILQYLLIVYDCSLFLLNIIGCIFYMPDITNLEKIYTPFMVYYIIYQLFSSTHVVINIRLLFQCDQARSRITPVAHNENQNENRNNIRRNEENNRRTNGHNSIYYVNDNESEMNRDMNTDLNYLYVKNIQEKTDGTIEYCCICMENLIKVKIFPCNHREFCLKCIEKLNEFKCPICRSKFNYIENEISMLNDIIISNT